MQDKIKTEEEQEEFNLLNPENYRNWIINSENAIQAAESKIFDIKNKLPEIVHTFNVFLEKLEVSDTNVVVGLIGDTMADRGAADYFTLKFLDLLSDNDLRIMISNHDMEFITAYENLSKNGAFLPKGDVINTDKPSFFALKAFLDEGIITKNELLDLINKAYKPALKVLDYTLNDNSINLFTHAPIRFDTIEKIANKLQVSYDDSNPTQLGLTIEKINIKFQHAVNLDQVSELCSSAGVVSATNMPLDSIDTHPLVNIIWNRLDKGGLDIKTDTPEARPESKNEFYINYIHGHDDTQSKLSHVLNLDTGLGKESPAQQLVKIKDAENEIETNGAEKDKAQHYLADIRNYKVLDSSLKGLDQTYRLNKLTEAAIDEYKLKRKNLIGLFSKSFDYSRGEKRADYYLYLLKTCTTSFMQLATIYALFASEMGKHLKEFVCRGIGFHEVEKVKVIFQEEIIKQLHNIYDDKSEFNQALDNLNKNFIGKIVKLTNSKKPVKSEDINKLMSDFSLVEKTGTMDENLRSFSSNGM